MAATKARKLAAILIILGIVLLGLSGVVMAARVQAGSGKKLEMTIEDYLAQGKKHYERGEYQEAILSYDRVISIDQNHQEALLLLGKAYANGRYYEDAEKTYQMVMDLDETDAEAGLELAQLYLLQGKRKEAKALLETMSQHLQDTAVMDLYEKTSVRKPEFSLASGSYDTYQLLEVTNQSPEIAVYYTTNGQEPTQQSDIYLDGIVISAPQTQIQAKAYNSLGYSSETVVLDYQITVKPEEILVGDRAMENALRQAIGDRYRGPLYNYQLAQIRELYIIGQERNWGKEKSASFYQNHAEIDNRYIETSGQIQDISSLAYCPFLKSLNIAFQGQLSLDGLNNLTGLTQLSLIHNQLTDISLLSNLTGLTQLSLGWNQITDVSPLSGLEKLQTLGLWGNQIQDVSPLSGLKNLYYFDVSDNQISDISIVSSMPNLSELWLYGNQVTDLSCTDSLTELKVLMARDNPIENYGTVLDRAYDLKRLDLEE